MDILHVRHGYFIGSNRYLSGSYQCPVQIITTLKREPGSGFDVDPRWPPASHFSRAKREYYAERRVKKV
jgi:hypothetical protein